MSVRRQREGWVLDASTLGASCLVWIAYAASLPTTSVRPKLIHDRDEAIEIVAAYFFVSRPPTLVTRPLKERARGAMDNIVAAITTSKMVEDEAIGVRLKPSGISVLVVTKVFNRHALSSIEKLTQKRGAGIIESVKSIFRCWLI